MENLILIEGCHKYKFQSLHELVETIIDKNYYHLSPDEKALVLEKKAFANCGLSMIPIINLYNGDDYLDNSFILYDEITYILSMLKFNKMILLEEKDSNIFTKSIFKKDFQGNYIIVNNFADMLLKEHLKQRSF